MLKLKSSSSLLISLCFVLFYRPREEDSSEADESSTRQSQMAVATWGVIWHTVDTPTLKLNAMVLKESPVARNLDKSVQN